MGRAIGIDLGTTNSCVAVYAGGGEPQVIPAPDGHRTTPSVVAITEDGARLVGHAAKRQAVMNPERTIASVKRLMGSRSDEIDTDDLPYRVVSGKGGVARVAVGDDELSPEQVSAMILAKLRDDAAVWLEEEVTDAVITVPAYFNDAQRQATKDAGRIAGLNVLRIINEPTAAALAYGLDRLDEDQTVLVFDLGGGTFDVSVLELGDGVFDVKATAGDNRLGGDDFDLAVVRWMLEEIESAHGISLAGDAQVTQRLLEAAEKAKLELSGLPETEINLPFLAHGPSGAPLHFTERLSRAKLEALVAPLLERLMRPTRQVLDDAGIEASGIDHLILVGGMTRMPAVQERVRQITGKEPTRSVNPDEVVALGAAVQAEVLSGDMRDVLLLDVTPLSLGIETRGGIFTRLIPRNTTIPVRKAETFTTAEDNQPSVDVHVLQGEREMASDNRSVGRVQLLGIPPAPRGVPQIEVSFELDANGILSVSAIDLGTGNSTDVRMMEGGSGLDEETLEQMIQDADRHRERDQASRQVAELRNRADGLIYSAEQALSTYGERITPEARDGLLDAVGELRGALSAEAEPGQLEAACQAVVAASHEAADQIYRSAAPDLTPDEPFPGEDIDDAVVEELEDDRD